MPIGLVAGHAGPVVAERVVRATQLFNAIPGGQLAAWRIFYFDSDSAVKEYTRRNFRNLGVNIATQTHCTIFCHGEYNPNNRDRSTGLSRWDIDESRANFNTGVYIDWLTNTGLGIQTIIVAAGDVGGGGSGNIPVQDLVAVRSGISADGPNSPLLALNGVNINWNANGAPVNWTRFQYQA